MVTKNKIMFNFKKGIITLVFNIWIFTAFSQQIQLGFNAGGNYSIFPLPEYNKYDGLSLGYTVGLSGQLRLKDHFFLSPEINFDYRVYRVKSSYHDAVSNSDERTSLLQIATPLKYAFGSKKTFYGYAGPYLAYSLISCSHYTVNESYRKVDFNDFCARYQFGYLIGLGYTHQLSGKINMFLDANYSESLFFFGEGEKEGRNSSKAIRLRTGLLFTIR